MGFLNTLNELGPALLQPLFGWLLDRSWSGAMVDGIRSYSSLSYHQSSLALLAVLGMAVLCLVFIRSPSLKSHLS